MYQVYQINLTDTLDSIANKYNISVDELLNINGNINPIPGKYIVVPNIYTNYQEYVVKQGDTINKIASYYNIDPNMLLLMNGLNKNDYIYPNEIILVPKDGFDIFITDDNTKINDLFKLGKIEDLISNNNIYLLPNQTILYRKEI